MKSRFLAGPYIAWMAIFTVVPLGMVVYFAFTDNSGAFTFANLTYAWEYWPVLLRSVWYAVAACLICLVVGYPVAYVIAQSTASVQRVLYLLVTLPMCMSFLLRTLAWVALLRDTGLINSFLGLFGIGPAPLIRNSGSVIMGMVYNYLPYMIMPLYTVIAKLDPRLIEAAQDLGCGSFQTFRRVVLPLSVPGIVSGITMVFVPAVSTLTRDLVCRYGGHHDRRHHRAPVQGQPQPEPGRGHEPHTHGAGVHQHRLMNRFTDDEEVATI